MFCYHCGKELPDDAYYCMRCGKPQHGKREHHEIVQFLRFAATPCEFRFRSNDEQLARHVFNIFKPVVKYPELLIIDLKDDAWNINYDGRKKWRDVYERSISEKASLVSEYALVNGWIAEPLRTNTDENGYWQSTAYSFTRKIET